jgi:hypothetical protein
VEFDVLPENPGAPRPGVFPARADLALLVEFLGGRRDPLGKLRKVPVEPRAPGFDHGRREDLVQSVGTLDQRLIRRADGGTGAPRDRDEA